MNLRPCDARSKGDTTCRWLLALRRPSEARRRHAGHVAAQVVMHVASVKAQRRPRLIGIAHSRKPRAPRRAEKLDGVGDRHRRLLAHIAGNSEGKIGKRKDRPAHNRPHAVEMLRPYLELAHRMTRREVNHPAPTSLAGKPIAREDLSHLFKRRVFRNKRCHLHPPLYQNRRVAGISSGLYAPTCRPHPRRQPKTPHVCVLISSQSHIPSLSINNSSSTRCFIKVPHNTFVTQKLKRKHAHFFRAASRHYAIKTAWARMHCVTSMGYINESPNLPVDQTGDSFPPPRPVLRPRDRIAPANIDLPVRPSPSMFGDIPGGRPHGRTGNEYEDEPLRRARRRARRR